MRLRRDRMFAICDEDRVLKAMAETQKLTPDKPFPYRAADLRLPLRIHQLRKRLTPSSLDRKALDGVVDLLFAADGAGDSRRLDALDRTAP